MTRSQATPASSQIIAMERMIEERDETIAAQAAVIEKLRKAVAYVYDINDSYQASKCVQEVLAIPTDSKEVLKAWLDEVLGEPVAWREFDGEGGYDYRSYQDNETFRDDYIKRNPNPIYKDWVEPLFRKPAL